MELKVCVDGVVRVVCGLTLSTSCRDVVIALAQSLGDSLLPQPLSHQISKNAFRITVFKPEYENDSDGEA